MAKCDPVYTAHQLRRWMAPNARLFVRPDWRRHVAPGSEAAALLELYERKYRGDQLRDDHGRFAYEGGQGKDGEARPNNLSHQTRIAARISASRREACEIQRRQDEFVCKSVQRFSCYAQAMLRYANCLQGLPIPPLFF